MLSPSVVRLVRRYLRQLRRAGLPVEAGIVFGSHARGQQRRGSDIDLLVLSPAFGDQATMAQTDLLWRLRGCVKWRVEPLPVSPRRWRSDRSSPILAAAREEGILVRL